MDNSFFYEKYGERAQTSVHSNFTVTPENHCQVAENSAIEEGKFLSMIILHVNEPLPGYPSIPFTQVLRGRP